MHPGFLISSWFGLAARVILCVVPATIGCATKPAPAPIPKTSLASTTQPPSPKSAPVTSPNSNVQPVSFQGPVLAPLPPMPEVASEAIPAPKSSGTLFPTPGNEPHLIDLPTALRLADADNLQVGIARWQVDQALARQQRAEALCLPSLRGGLNYNRHEGAIQDVVGNQFDTSRSAFYSGAGAGAVGAGSPVVPGILAQFHLTDALFQPLAAKQAVGARSNAATAVRNNTLLQVSLAYQELQRAAQETAIAKATLLQAQELAELTAQFAKVGQGAAADADRAAAELAQRQIDVLRGEEGLRVAGARLAQILRLDVSTPLFPAEPTVVPLEFVSLEIPVRELTAIGLSQRPELTEQRYLVGEAVQRLRREKYAPLIPSVMLGASYGGFNAGQGTDYPAMQDRLDVDALAYWELRNFGHGDQAAKREANSVLRQQQLRQMESLDLVAREVVEAHAQVQVRARMLSLAEQGWRAAESSRAKNWERIRAVQGLPIEMLQANNALDTAQRSYLRAVIDYNSAQLTLQRALGYPVKLTVEN